MVLTLMNEKKSMVGRMTVMNDELFEIFELVEKVLSSDNQTAKDALRKFIMIATMIEGSETQSGHFRDYVLKLQQEIRMLSERLNRVERESNPLTDGYGATGNKSIYDYYRNVDKTVWKYDIDNMNKF